MKKPIIITFSAIFLLAVAVGAYLLNGCQKNVETIELITAYVVSGKVVDDKTSQPLADVIITCLEKSATTNSDGIYTFYLEEFPDDLIKISAKKDGYPVGTTIITSGSYSSVNTIRLMPPAISKTIDDTGGSLSIGNTESIDESQKIEVIFPEGALNNSTEISMTPLEGIAIPDISPRKTLGLLNAATVSLEPSGLTLNQNATASFPLPMKMDPGTELELLSYDEDNLTWGKSGIIATVDATGSIAVAEITHFSTYSIGIEGDYTEEFSDSNWLEELSPDQEEYCYQATVEYPDGVPDDISLVWMKNAVSQNTELGGRVSFFEPTCIPVKNNTETTKSAATSRTATTRAATFNFVCECPDYGEPPCDDCYLVSYVRICVVTIDEILEINYPKDDGWENKRVGNTVTFEKSITCERWHCPPSCYHKGGSGN